MILLWPEPSQYEYVTSNTSSLILSCSRTYSSMSCWRCAANAASRSGSGSMSVLTCGSFPKCFFPAALRISCSTSWSAWSSASSPNDSLLSFVLPLRRAARSFSFSSSFCRSCSSMRSVIFLRFSRNSSADTKPMVSCLNFSSSASACEPPNLLSMAEKVRFLVSFSIFSLACSISRCSFSRCLRRRNARPPSDEWMVCSMLLALS
mmetsp:Transcript_33245/g.82301  ORF Transcript_33245/g.82301 Transcript_33245/m.82301 type:complete len:206 (-) Transcript_33245:52-669(-)